MSPYVTIDKLVAVKASRLVVAMATVKSGDKTPSSLDELVSTAHRLAGVLDTCDILGAEDGLTSFARRAELRDLIKDALAAHLSATFGN